MISVVDTLARLLGVRLLLSVGGLMVFSRGRTYATAA